jgi:hypothetical protein
MTNRSSLENEPEVHYPKSNMIKRSNFVREWNLNEVLIEKNNAAGEEIKIDENILREEFDWD